ncbi:MAG: hypothetical protein NTNFB02_10290 [Nitrospira sp.]
MHGARGKTPEGAQDFKPGNQGSAAPENSRASEHGAQGPEEGEPGGPTFFESVPPEADGINSS